MMAGLEASLLAVDAQSLSCPFMRWQETQLHMLHPTTDRHHPRSPVLGRRGKQSRLQALAPKDPPKASDKAPSKASQRAPTAAKGHKAGASPTKATRAQPAPSKPAPAKAAEVSMGHEDDPYYADGDDAYALETTQARDGMGRVAGHRCRHHARRQAIRDMLRVTLTLGVKTGASCIGLL